MNIPNNLEKDKSKEVSFLLQNSRKKNLYKKSKLEKIRSELHYSIKFTA